MRGWAQMGPFRKRARAPEDLAKLSKTDERARRTPRGGLDPNLMTKSGAPRPDQSDRAHLRAMRSALRRHARCARTL
jgi:hypothetical protein